MKKILLLFMILFMCGNSFAWEIDMKGEYEFQFLYLSRMGAFDLFGNTIAAQSNEQPGLTTIGFAGQHAGIVVPEGYSSKGSDGAFLKEKLWLYPTIKINEAVKLRSIVTAQGNLNGLYQGGSNWANPNGYAGWFLPTSRSEDLANLGSVVGIQALWFTAETPIGTLVAGRRPFAVGTGWSGLHGQDTATSSVELISPYGPMKYKAAFVLHDTGMATDPYDTRNVDKGLYTIASSTDRNLAKNYDFNAEVAYANGPLRAGIFNRTVAWNNVHTYPQGQGTLRDDRTGSFAANFLRAPVNSGTSGNTTSKITPVFGDVWLTTWLAYFEYYNGRMFLNAEYDQQWITATRLGGRPISGTPRAWFIEAGGVLGPAKLSLANFYRSGHDRRGGFFNVISSAGTNAVSSSQTADKWEEYVHTTGGYSVLDPYAFLIGFYGTGNNAFSPSGFPTYKDFIGYAIRGDYAVASNLNLYMSWLYAQRQSNTSTWWGEFTGGIDKSPFQGSNVPDNYLGNEFNAGLDWKLLESLNLTARYSYWQPGDWFKFAYTDYGQQTLLTDPAPGGVDVRITPTRTISPIQAFQIGFKTDF